MTRRARPVRRRLLVAAGVVGLAGVLALSVPWAWLRLATRDVRLDASDPVPPRPVAIVLGAGVTADGSPTPFLAQRVAVAADLYRRGTVRALLMSGDHSRNDYDEVEAMAALARRLGVPDPAIVLDHAGFDTYSSCYRARHVWGLERAVVVTQPFHLARAVWLCDRLGVDVVGVGTAADPVPQTTQGELREVPAAAKAVLDVVLRRRPTFPGPVEHTLDGLSG